jgi:hypothetical protein
MQCCAPATKFRLTSFSLTGYALICGICMLFERTGGGGEGCSQGQLEWGPRAWDGGGGGVMGLSAVLCQLEEANAVAAVVCVDSPVLLALASFHRRSWRRLFCRRLYGRRRRL